jgi:abelson tyrosine-protein kinase 1
MACVSLVERCADILFAVREEIDLAGGRVEDTLRDPVERLTEYVNCQPVVTVHTDRHT